MGSENNGEAWITISRGLLYKKENPIRNSDYIYRVGAK